MKTYPIAISITAAVLAMTPVVMADSYTYTITGSNFSATLYLTATANEANGVATSGVDTITSVAGSFTVGGTTYEINTPIAPVAANPGSDATNPTNNGAFLFDNLLYPGALQNNGILDWDGLLINDGSYELNLFSGAFGGISGNSSPGNTYFYFADNGSNYSNNRIPDAVNGNGPALASLVATPEPGSLFLLGSGLLGLAFIVFRKSKASRVTVPA